MENPTDTQTSKEVTMLAPRKSSPIHPVPATAAGALAESMTRIEAAKHAEWHKAQSPFKTLKENPFR